MMKPILLQIGKFKLYSFGSLIALGALVGGWFFYRLACLAKLKTDRVFDIILYSLLFGLISARLGYYFAYQNQFQSFREVFLLWQGGLLALPGLVVGFLVFLHLIRQDKQPLWPILDIAGLSFLIAWSIGKFGCHLSGCTLGRPTDSFIAIESVFPTDLLSSLWAILLFVIMFIAYMRKRLSNGVVFFLAMEGLFLGELLIKTLRVDFGEGLARIEAMIYLGLIIMVYLVFWRLHGPRIQRQSLTANLKNFVYRRIRR